MAGRAFSDIAPLTKYRLLFGAALGGSVLAALFCLFYWFTLDPARSLQVSLPGGDGRPKDAAGKGKAVDLAGVFAAGEGVAADLPGAWPRFRGPDFDNIVKADVKLAGSWGTEGPKRLWDVELGEGHAAAVVLNGRVYVLDYDEDKRADAIRCLSLGDGKEIWRRAYSVAIKRNHGMSRTIPAVTEEYLVTVGPKCHVVCLDPKTGDFKWGLSMVDQLGATEPLWYTGQCPLIDGGKVIIAPGGPDALLAAVDCATGQVVWKTPNPDKWKMSHSSVLPLTLAGTRMYVYAAVGGVVGVSPDDGKLLWSVPWNAEVVAASPVALDDGRVFLTAGYGAGGLMLRVTAKDGGFVAEVLDKHTAAEGFACEQQTPIFRDGLLYGIMPKDAGALRGQFVCYTPDGTLVWSSGQANRYGLGPFVLADGKFYVLSDDGTLTVLEASADKFVEV
ncbi:MAG: PQQ-binding-like beta-propeller repeat protein, partial [FCB group bacterium]|nr:PQQ-binding-like beta-propeller repeat protein [FCB group bacterium]